MKRILLLVVLFASLLFVTACGSANNPMISDPDGIYLTVKEGQYTYTVTRRRIYDMLKSQVGYTMLKDIIDTDLLKNTLKDGKSYWESVTENEINERLEEDIFPSGTEGLTEEEINEKRTKYFDKLFEDYGLMTEEEVLNYYRLNIAKEKYAKDQLLIELEEKDFTDTQYQNYFNNNFKDEYYAIVVSFDNERMLLNALQQLGYKFSNNTTLAKIDGTPLTKQEVIKMFIELYNMVNIAKVEDYPTSTLLLKEGKHYNVVNGNIEFDLEEIDVLHYSNKQITNYESAIEKALNEFDSYDEGDKFYTKTPRTYKNGARISMYMKIDQISHTLEDKKSEIREALIDQRLTASYISTQVAKLRVKNNVVFFDREFNESFANEAATYEVEYKNSKKTSKTLVAKTDVKEYSADDLFKVMNHNYGISSAISEIEFQRFVDNLSINNIYDFKNKKALDESRWNIILQSLKDEKANFKKNLYAEDGYPKSMGWKNFIKEVYGANSELELQKYFVYQDVRDRYSKSLGALEGLNENSDLWNFYNEQMQKMVADYFKVTGVHLLITVYNSNNSPVDPKDWTETQIAYAKEFYNQVMDYLNNTEITDSAEKKIQNVQNAFNRAPYFVPGIPQNTASQPEVDGLSYVFNGIEISKFKSAGLSVTFQDLGTFTNGTMVKEFNDAAKSIWDANSNSKDVVIYGNTKDDEGNYEYLVTQFGYHIYVNKETHPIEEYATGKILPSFADAVEFIKDNSSTNLSTKLKTALNTYFKPIHTELTSTNYLQVTSYKQIKNLEITFNHTDYTNTDFVRFLDLTIATKESSLKYNK